MRRRHTGKPYKSLQVLISEHFELYVRQKGTLTVWGLLSRTRDFILPQRLPSCKEIFVDISTQCVSSVIFFLIIFYYILIL